MLEIFVVFIALIDNTNCLKHTLTNRYIIGFIETMWIRGRDTVVCWFLAEYTVYVNLAEECHRLKQTQYKLIITNKMGLLKMGYHAGLPVMLRTSSTESQFKGGGGTYLGPKLRGSAPVIHPNLKIPRT